MSGIKRIQRDLLEWEDSSRDFPHVRIVPIEENMFMWHFNITVDVSNVPLHGKIRFPKNYPSSPPSVFFSRHINHAQVTKTSRGFFRLCLDMLSAGSDRFHSGWSSAYSIVCLVAQIDLLLFEIRENEKSLIHEDRGRKPLAALAPSKCLHCDNARVEQRDVLVLPSTERELWSMLYVDVESLIFSFLRKSDLDRLALVNVQIANSLHQLRFFQWSMIECYHSRNNFGDFMLRHRDVNCVRAAVDQNVFGMGFITEFYENNSNRNSDRRVLNNVYVCPDILSYHAFSSGVRFSMWRDFRFDYFLPLYLNDDHGGYALEMVSKTIRQIYGKDDSSADFDPILALRFLSKLMNTTVVSMMSELDSDSANISLFTSTKAIQAYMYFYHLLLGFIDKYPVIVQHAEEQVSNFIHNDEMRNKTNYPDLGEFLVYLAIVDVAWIDIGPVVAKESQTRAAKWILEKYPSLISCHSNQQESCIRLRQSWKARVVGCRLLMFQVYFIQEICCDGDVSSRLSLYNSTLGKASEAACRNLQIHCRRVFQVDDWLEYYQAIKLPCPSARQLSHTFRQAMVWSDAKGYQRFAKTKIENLDHTDPNLCLCSGRVRDVRSRANARGDSGADRLQRQSLDVAFSIDCTSSMQPYLNSVKQHIRDIARQLAAQDEIDVRFAVVGYRDHNETGGVGGWLTKVCQFSSLSNLSRELQKFSCGGGGIVEAVADSWHEIVNLKWRRFSVKCAVHISDMGCHGARHTNDLCPCGHDPIRLAHAMAESNIVLYNVGCKLPSLDYKYFYEGTARITGGLYLSIEHYKKLPQIIVESARENVSLASIVDMMGPLYNQFRRANPYATQDQLAMLLWKDLVGKNVTTEKIEHGRLTSQLSKYSVEISECKDLGGCRKVIRSMPKIFTDDYRVGGTFKFVYEYGFSMATVFRLDLQNYTVYSSSGTVHCFFKMDEEKVSDIQSVDAKARSRLITLEQTIRCMKRVVVQRDHSQWVEKGCLYRMKKYGVVAAKQRFSEYGLEYDETMKRIVCYEFRSRDSVEYTDAKTGKVFAGRVENENRENYSFTVLVPALRTRVNCMKASLRLHAWGTTLTGCFDDYASRYDVPQSLDKGPRQRQRGLSDRQAFFAALHGDYNGVDEYTSSARCKSIDMSDANGRTMLHFAGRGGFVDVVTLLLDRGADPNMQDRDGKTALQAVEACLAERRSKNLVKVKKLLSDARCHRVEREDVREVQLSGKMCELSIRNLPTDCTATELTRFLKRLGFTLVRGGDVTVQVSRHSGKGFSFVRVSNGDDRKIETANRQMFQGAPIYVSISSGQTRRAEDDTPPSCALFVAGLSGDSEDEVRSLIRKTFGKFGTLSRRPYVNVDKNGKYYGFVTFESVLIAERAKSKLDGIRVGGERLSVRFKKDGSTVRSQPRHANQGDRTQRRSNGTPNGQRGKNYGHGRRDNSSKRRRGGRRS